MKRVLLGIFLLLGLPALGLLVNQALEIQQLPISTALEAAAEQALTGDFEEARESVRHARQQWEDGRKFTVGFCSHSVPDQVDSLFARLEVYGQTGDLTEFASACRELAYLLGHLTEAQQPDWWNLM